MRFIVTKILAVCSIVLVFSHSAVASVNTGTVGGSGGTHFRTVCDENRVVRPVFVSISLDSENDTGDKLLKYATQFSANLDSWHFASGEKNTIDELATALWVGQQSREDGQIDHRMILHLLDNNLELVQRYSADPIDIERVSA